MVSERETFPLARLVLLEFRSQPYGTFKCSRNDNKTKCVEIAANYYESAGRTKCLSKKYQIVPDYIHVIILSCDTQRPKTLD